MKPEELEAMKRNIEAQLDEYEQAIEAYRVWVADYRARHPLPQPAQEPAET